MEITKELQELAKLSTAPFLVLSVYLNTPDQAHRQQEQSLAFLMQHLRQAQAFSGDSDAVRASLAHDLERVAQWGEERLRVTPDTTMAGYALFACSGAEVWIEFPSPLPFENEFTIADRPALRQLARLDADYANALVVLVYTHSARVYEVVLGGLMAETGLASTLPTPYTDDSWTHMRYRHDVKAHLYRHHQEVAAYLTAYVSERPDTVLLVSGEDEAIGHLRQELPPHVQQRIIDAVSLDLGDTHARILQVARNALVRHEHEEDQASIQLLLQRAGAGGLAVLGLQQTLLAVNAGWVHKLIIHNDFRSHGWRCQACDNIDEGMPQRCTICGGQVMAVELGEALVSAVLQADGFVEPVAPDTRLAPYDGVGALLRRK